ncbi:MarR family winged helix-turn-helix transcriptional regulator [Streptomyces fructofermentans]|uniref:Uncharacterized protein n=1 Tax=Streptomyces fructofermentans TaxID=152141 RepID=A0A918KJ61_9ACTN|nr:MarR family transcriptional regulator [Streptomyces fructofermentans]GGX62898.1 hypothetical protein GCM10010515_33200 [Streptomyces fructofermentans]
MQYSHSDAELVRQPIGYWSWAAHRATVDRIRAALAEIGTTQPQCWVLARVADAGTAKNRDDVSRLLGNYLDTGADGVDAEIDATVDRGWVAQDAEGGLRLTAAGTDFYVRAAALQADLWEERHRGISEEDYLTTLKVLQRFIHNTGGRAWHH